MRCNIACARCAEYEDALDAKLTHWTLRRVLTAAKLGHGSAPSYRNARRNDTERAMCEALHSATTDTERSTARRNLATVGLKSTAVEGPFPHVNGPETLLGAVPTVRPPGANWILTTAMPGTCRLNVAVVEPPAAGVGPRPPGRCARAAPGPLAEVSSPLLATQGCRAALA